jgi:hypothetical protein
VFLAIGSFTRSFVIMAQVCTSSLTNQHGEFLIYLLSGMFCLTFAIVFYVREVQAVYQLRQRLISDNAEFKEETIE